MIDDGAPLLPVTEEELRADAKKLGISYEDYLSALDNHIPYNEIYEYVKNCINEHLAPTGCFNLPKKPLNQYLRRFFIPKTNF